MGRRQKSNFDRLYLALWGHDSAPRFDLAAWIFLRAMGLMYVSAFVSFGAQAQGLIGSHGILPLSEYTGALHHQLGAEAYWRLPMLFWLDHGDFAIQAVCWAGAVLSLLLTFNILPRASLILLYALYLSLFYAGQVFMSFQWDLLLLETGFLALILSVAQKPGIWLLRWLLFRFMFLSGSVKLLSGDPSWASLSALSYHFHTQPLPTPLAWYADHLPRDLLTAGTAALFVVELILPFLIFMPRRARIIAAAGILLLEFLIFLTGNYNFFNLLTMLLCLPLFDDSDLRAVLPRSLVRYIERHSRYAAPKKPVIYAVNLFVLLAAFIGGMEIYGTYAGSLPEPAADVMAAAEPLRLVNGYGLFAVMTTTRPEIVIEGSEDGEHWEEYGFKYKPGDVMRPPLWNIPHQPRLDWQMWFAALGNRYQNPWFANLLHRLLENASDVTALLEINPFPYPHKPRYVRALLYDYRFTTPAEHSRTGAWWVRQPEGVYFPAASLQP